MDNSNLPDLAEGTTEEVVKSNTEEVESAIDNNDKPADTFAENDANDGKNAEKQTESLKRASVDKRFPLPISYPIFEIYSEFPSL